ncbi:MAG: hypothetical protein QNJ51_11515 [Calothrix sp. MO_167.B12]|nr:hypothetical protein [Calothrix sp. MO_167.B12]
MVSNLNSKARSVSLKQTKAVPLHEVAARVMQGEIIIVQGCLQAIGYFDRLQKANLEGIRRAVGEEKAARVIEQGFEAIHQTLSWDELSVVVNRTYEVVCSLDPDFSKAIVRSIFQFEKPFYFEDYPNVRFHIPYDVAREQQKSLTL